jgi:hypothetical protein
VPNFRNRLTGPQRKVYDRSNAIPGLRLRVSPRLARAVSLLPTALAGDYPDEVERRRKVNKVAQVICDEICAAMRVSPLRVVVKGVRPIENSSEYHGLYVSEGRSHEITVWMYTAKRKQVVAPRTLLRTLLHEMVHHLDYNKLGLEESFHTDGFFKRESSLVRQVERAARTAPGVAGTGPARTQGRLALRSKRANDDVRRVD